MATSCTLKKIIASPSRPIQRPYSERAVRAIAQEKATLWTAVQKVRDAMAYILIPNTMSHRIESILMLIEGVAGESKPATKTIPKSLYMALFEPNSIPEHPIETIILLRRFLEGSQYHRPQAFNIPELSQEVARCEALPIHTFEYCLNVLSKWTGTPINIPPFTKALNTILNQPEALADTFNQAVLTIRPSIITALTKKSTVTQLKNNLKARYGPAFLESKEMAETIVKLIKASRLPGFANQDVSTLIELVQGSSHTLRVDKVEVLYMMGIEAHLSLEEMGHMVPIINPDHKPPTEEERAGIAKREARQNTGAVWALIPKVVQMQLTQLLGEGASLSKGLFLLTPLSILGEEVLEQMGQVKHKDMMRLAMNSALYWGIFGGSAVALHLVLNMPTLYSFLATQYEEFTDQRVTTPPTPAQKELQKRLEEEAKLAQKTLETLEARRDQKLNRYPTTDKLRATLYRYMGNREVMATHEAGKPIGREIAKKTAWAVAEMMIFNFIINATASSVGAVINGVFGAHVPTSVQDALDSETALYQKNISELEAQAVLSPEEMEIQRGQIAQRYFEAVIKKMDAYFTAIPASSWTDWGLRSLGINPEHFKDTSLEVKIREINERMQKKITELQTFNTPDLQENHRDTLIARYSAFQKSLIDQVTQADILANAPTSWWGYLGYTTPQDTVIKILDPSQTPEALYDTLEQCPELSASTPLPDKEKFLSQIVSMIVNADLKTKVQEAGCRVMYLPFLPNPIRSTLNLTKAATEFATEISTAIQTHKELSSENARMAIISWMTTVLNRLNPKTKNGVKAVYGAFAKNFHPDKTKNHTLLTELFKIVSTWQETKISKLSGESTA